MTRITNKEKVIALFKPNDDGVSDWVRVERFSTVGLNWTKNGNIRRGVAFGVKSFKWDIRRVGGGRSEVTALKLVGHNDDDTFSTQIRSDIKEKLKEKGYCNFSLLPIPDQYKEVDHRWGYKEHSKYHYLYDLNKQSIDDFQLTHQSQNSKKRQMCIECKSSNKRPKHPEGKDFVEGDENLDDINVCSGCYLAQPERYR